jgi:hypothetical protein
MDPRRVTQCTYINYKSIIIFLKYFSIKYSVQNSVLERLFLTATQELRFAITKFELIILEAKSRLHVTLRTNEHHVRD